MTSFTKEMRKATRDVHALSDSLVNAKLVFALSNDEVWAEGLLIFYEIFRYLEESMTRLSHTLIGELDIEGMRRTNAFERDLAYYLGSDWKQGYVPRKEVQMYIEHLQQLEENDPHCLMAYIYHLYMGLLSGGQILQKKRRFFSKFNPFASNELGYDVTHFGGYSISHIKRDLVKMMNKVAVNLGEHTKQKIIDESREVFIRNNNIIKTVRGANKVMIKKVIVILLSLGFVLLLIYNTVV